MVKIIPQAQLLIIGDGPIKKELVLQVKSVYNEKQIVFTGSMKHDKLLESGAFHPPRAPELCPADPDTTPPHPEASRRTWCPSIV